SLSPDGRRVLFVGTNGAAQVFEPLSNPHAPLAMLRPGGRVVQAMLSPASGQPLRVATRLAARTVRFWNGETGEALSPPLIRGLAMGVTLLDHSWVSEWIVTTRFSPAGDRVLVALNDHR